MSDDNTSSRLSLTAKEKILLHLKEYWKYKDEAETPKEVTQKGISEATGLPLSHIPRTLKKMREEELIVDSKRYVSGATRRYKTYFLTDAGVKLSRSVMRDLGEKVITTPDGERPLSDMLAENPYKNPLSVIISLMEGGGEPAPAKTKRFMVGSIPFPENFVNRKDELEAIDRHISGDEPKILVVYGSHGYGTTSLTAKYLEGQKDKWSIIWLDLEKRPDHILEELGETVQEAGFDIEINGPEDFVSLLDGQKVIVVFDGYFHLPDKTVEFFSDLVERIRGRRNLKLIFTAREDTPSYNRFYTVIDLHDSTVSELHVKGLDIDAFRQMLDDESIADDAITRLFMFSRGKPGILKLMAEGDKDALEKVGQFTPEEIKLMLHLKTLKD